MGERMPITVFLSVGEGRAHFDQAEQIMRTTKRTVKFIFLQHPYTRWHVPQFCDFADLALWVDLRFPVTFDIEKLWRIARADKFKAVYVLEDQKTHSRPDLMLFRSKFCTLLDSEYIFAATPEQLNPEVWAGGPDNVGVLKGHYASIPVSVREQTSDDGSMPDF